MSPPSRHTQKRQKTGPKTQVVPATPSDGEEQKKQSPKRDVSPRRAKMRAEAAKKQKAAGKKRQTAHFNKVKGPLDVGDVVDVPVSHKYKSGVGDSVLCGTVFAKLPHGKYSILTQAGVLDLELPRNRLQIREDVHADHLLIDDNVSILPMITEGDALRLINPHRIAAIFCTCKKVLSCPCQILPICRLIVSMTSCSTMEGAARKPP